MSEISELISYLNESGGIALNIVSENKTNWLQFSLTMFISLIGAFFILYFVFQMTKELYINGFVKLRLRLIKQKTKRHQLVIKHTQNSLFDVNMISEETLRKIQTALQKFKGKDFDLILHTPGGSIFFTLLVSILLREYNGKIRAIIPSYAMSGGSLLALSCDELYMSPTSSIGPIDPQLGSLFKFGSAKSWERIIKMKGKKAEDSSIGFAFSGSQYTKSLSIILKDIIKDKIPKDKLNPFVKLLTSGDIEHSYILTPDKLSQLGLDIKIISPILQKRYLKIISSSSSEGVHYI